MNISSSDERERRKLLRILKFYPPFVGAGIRVKSIAPGFRTIEVEMPLRFWNKNLVGTHFGGSLYAMCDPFFMMILIRNLGPEYIVWDKAATIRFKRPGKGLVRASFHIDEARIAEIRQQADSQSKVEPEFTTVVTDLEGTVIAEVDKLLYVRKKTG